jgi:hypothetical protein
MEICLRSTSICSSVMTLTYPPNPSPPPALSSGAAAAAAALVLSPQSITDHPLATGRTKWPGSEGGHATGIGKVARCLCSGMELRMEGNRPVRQAPGWSLGGDAGGGWRHRDSTRPRVHASLTSARLGIARAG